MNFKCLIELLKEKEYIVEKDQYSLGGKPCVSIFSTKHDIVIEKIIDCVDEGWLVHRLNNYEIDIINLKVLEDWLEEKCSKEVSYINAVDFSILDNQTIQLNAYSLEMAINNCIEDYKAEFEFHNRKIINLKARKNRLIEEERKEKEVVDFINSLP